jgi:hypothetical protein
MQSCASERRSLFFAGDQIKKLTEMAQFRKCPWARVVRDAVDYYFAEGKKAGLSEAMAAAQRERDEDERLLAEEAKQDAEMMRAKALEREAKNAKNKAKVEAWRAERAERAKRVLY